MPVLSRNATALLSLITGLVPLTAQELSPAVDVFRRGGLTKSEPSRLRRDYFALRVAVNCDQRAGFLVEVDFVDRFPPASPGGPPGPAVRYLPSYRTYGPLDGPQRTLGAAKRSVEAGVNDYLRANFTSR